MNASLLILLWVMFWSSCKSTEDKCPVAFFKNPFLKLYLIDHNIVNSLPDLYHLDLNTIAGLERMGQKSAQNLLNAIEASEQTQLEKNVK